MTNCGCYEKANEALGARNTRIKSYFTLNGSRIGRPWPIETEQVEKGRGKGKALGLFASFCPLCGSSLAEPEKEVRGSTP